MLNYGQGEGQVRIDEGVWGIYVGDSTHYYLVFEEGGYEESRFLELLREIAAHIEAEFGGGTLNFVGALSNEESK